MRRHRCRHAECALPRHFYRYSARLTSHGACSCSQAHAPYGTYADVSSDRRACTRQVRFVTCDRRGVGGKVLQFVLAAVFRAATCSGVHRLVGQCLHGPASVVPGRQVVLCWLPGSFFTIWMTIVFKSFGPSSTGSPVKTTESDLAFRATGRLPSRTPLSQSASALCLTAHAARHASWSGDDAAAQASTAARRSCTGSSRRGARATASRRRWCAWCTTSTWRTPRSSARPSPATCSRSSRPTAATCSPPSCSRRSRSLTSSWTSSSSTQT